MGLTYFSTTLSDSKLLIQFVMRRISYFLIPLLKSLNFAMKSFEYQHLSYTRHKQ